VCLYSSATSGHDNANYQGVYHDKALQIDTPGRQIEMTCLDLVVSIPLSRPTYAAPVGQHGKKKKNDNDPWGAAALGLEALRRQAAQRHCSERNLQASLVEVLLSAGARASASSAGRVNAQTLRKRSDPKRSILEPHVFALADEDTGPSIRLLVSGPAKALVDEPLARPGTRSFPAGSTALMVAAACGMMPTVSVLLELGADPTLTNSAGRTALHYAMRDAFGDRFWDGAPLGESDGEREEGGFHLDPYAQLDASDVDQEGNPKQGMTGGGARLSS
jgi:hypothetical protein